MKTPGAPADGRESCDQCGPDTSAAYRASQAGELYLCGTCAQRHWRALTNQGWTFWPLSVRAIAPQGRTLPARPAAASVPAGAADELITETELALDLLTTEG